MNKKSITYKYVDYKESDFLSDAYFQEWVYQPSADLDAFWQQVIAALPQQKETIENARLYLQNISFVTHTPSDEAIANSWEKQLQLIQAIPERRSGVRRLLLRAAAVVAGALLLAGGWYLLQQKGAEQFIASTGFGEIKQVLLPDGSKVDLNANSKITYSKREVWLEGEALFNVAHNNKEFLVHTKDLTVTVLGTIFDIRQRRRKTEIVLQSGKIKLSFASGKEQDIIMTPGQIVSYNDQEKRSKTSSTSPEKFSAWKNQRLILQDPTVSDILVYLEDNFGKKIIMEDPALSNRTVNGPILISSLDDALFVLSTVLNTEVVKRDSTTIIMRSRSSK
ncbi:FecR domain-containing protein [Chitinophaga sp.]|uniref:FecR family protein n=1 Tax=Chitinophaga sp. TaxID=1869181 RepID=UPI0031D8DEF0